MKIIIALLGLIVFEPAFATEFEDAVIICYKHSTIPLVGVRTYDPKFEHCKEIIEKKLSQEKIQTPADTNESDRAKTMNEARKLR